MHPKNAVALIRESSPKGGKVYVPGTPLPPKPVSGSKMGEFRKLQRNIRLLSTYSEGKEASRLGCISVEGPVPISRDSISVIFN